MCRKMEKINRVKMVVLIVKTSLRINLRKIQTEKSKLKNKKIK